LLDPGSDAETRVGSVGTGHCSHQHCEAGSVKGVMGSPDLGSAGVEYPRRATVPRTKDQCSCCHHFSGYLSAVIGPVPDRPDGVLLSSSREKTLLFSAPSWKRIDPIAAGRCGSTGPPGWCIGEKLIQVPGRSDMESLSWHHPLCHLPKTHRACI
jgi:hypothetical protein